MKAWSALAVIGLVSGLALVGAFVASTDARGSKLDAPPPPGAPKLANLKPVAVQGFNGVQVMFPVILPRDPVYPGSGGKGGPLGGLSGRFAYEVVRIQSDPRALSCTGRLLGKPGRGGLVLGVGLPKAVSRSTQKKWANTLRDTKTQLGAMGVCAWGLSGRLKLARETISGTWILNYGEFWTGTPGSISKRFTVRGMCDRPGCPISRQNPFFVLNVTG